MKAIVDVITILSNVMPDWFKVGVYSLCEVILFAVILSPFLFRERHQD